MYRSTLTIGAAIAAAIAAAFWLHSYRANATAAAGAGDGHSVALADQMGTRADLVEELREHVKHVFIIYQENHSYDEYFGAYPAGDNFASASAAAHGLRQYDPIGKQWVTPFRIADPDIDSPSHGRAALLAKMDGGANDHYIAQQEKDSAGDGYGPADQDRVGLLTMAYYDCDTLPYLWKYAQTFALYDRIFEGMVGPSTPGNIEIIAAQSGQTQAARNPSEAQPADKKGDPIVSSIDPPYGPYSETPGKTAIPQRYATVMLTLSGRRDAEATEDTAGVRNDLAFVAASKRSPITWGWYQEGYNPPGTSARKGYEAHHNAVQYFAYMRHNDVFWNNVHDVKQLLPQLRNGTLPDESVTYIKGGTYNDFGWRPATTDKGVAAQFMGDDDHPGTGDSDRHISEAFVATFVNAIARSRYWKDSAIIVTWDDSGGYFDHAVPPQFERCFDGHPCGDGPRVPFLLISPYAKSGAVVSDSGDTGSVVKFIETLFGLPALASLPDEKPYMPEGPRDANARITDLLGGFDPARLSGAATPLPAQDAIIDGVDQIPPRMNCKTLGITPITVPGSSGQPPKGYGPRAIQYIP